MPGGVLHLILLLADGFMLGVISCVQWIVYPSCRRMQHRNLRAWHHLYSRRISWIVIPPMAIQLFGGSLRAGQHPGWESALYLVTILFLWAFTFATFVPLHSRIGSGQARAKELLRLVRRNRIRTLLWAFVFLWNLILYM